MGKRPKKRVFGNFDPDNRMTKKNDLSYLVGNFTTNSKMVSFFTKNDFSCSYDVIKTPFLAIFVIFGV